MTLVKTITSSVSSGILNYVYLLIPFCVSSSPSPSSIILLYFIILFYLFRYLLYFDNACRYGTYGSFSSEELTAPTGDILSPSPSASFSLASSRDSMAPLLPRRFYSTHLTSCKSIRDDNSQHLSSYSRCQDEQMYGPLLSSIFLSPSLDVLLPLVLPSLCS